MKKTSSQVLILCLVGIVAAYLWFSTSQDKRSTVSETIHSEINKDLSHSGEEPSDKNSWVGGADELWPDFMIPELVLADESVVVDFDAKMVALWDENPNELTDIYGTLADNVERRLMEQTSIDEVIPNSGKERVIIIEITDGETWNGIWWVAVSLWWALVWETDAAWRLVRERKLPRTYDYLYFQASKPGYTPAYTKKSLFFTEWKDIAIDMQMKQKPTKSIQLDENTSGDVVAVEEDDMSVVFVETCALTTALWDCYEWSVTMEYQFIEPDEIAETSIPMRALVDGEVINLASNWMAFIDFYGEAWEMLLYDWDVAEICYTIPQERIDIWQESAQEWDMDGYRYFNTSDWLWRFDDEAEISVAGWRFCAKTKHIY